MAGWRLNQAVPVAHKRSKGAHLVCRPERRRVTIRMNSNVDLSRTNTIPAAVGFKTGISGAFVSFNFRFFASPIGSPLLQFCFRVAEGGGPGSQIGQSPKRDRRTVSQGKQPTSPLI